MFNINWINEFYKTWKIKNTEILEEKNKFIYYANHILKNIVEKKVDDLDIKELKILEASTKNLHSLLLDEIIPYEALEEITNISLNYNIFEVNKNNIDLVYENYAKFYLIEKIWKNIGLNINTNKDNIYQKIITFNNQFKKLKPKEYFNIINQYNLKNLLEIKSKSSIDFLPLEIIFQNEKDFKNFLNLTWFIFWKNNPQPLETFVSEIIQKNTVKLFLDYMRNVEGTLEKKFKLFLDFYNDYISSNIYLVKVRKDFIEIFWELFINFKWIDNLKENYLLKKYPDKLLRYTYIKYYPSFREILEDITTQNVYERLNLGFVSTIAFFERIYEKWLQKEYSHLMRELYFKLVYPKIEKYKKNKPEKYSYLKRFLDTYSSFENDISENITKIDLINNLENIKHISDYIKLHKKWKISKKLNKKDLKKLINDTIYFNEIRYLLDNNLINVKKLSEFIDLCIPNLTTTWLIFLWMDKNLKQFLSKQKLLKLLKETKDIKFLVLLEKFGYTLTNKEQKQIIETLKNETNTIKLALLLGSKLITKEYKKSIFEKLKNNYYFLQ